MKILMEQWKNYLKETIGLDDKPNLSKDPNAFKTVKRPIELKFRYAGSKETIKTKEGTVTANKGDAIMTGTEGEQWPIPAADFAQNYNILKPGIAAKDQSIEVFAKEMSDKFQVKPVWSDDLLSGKPGDYLVQYGTDDYGIVDKDIFRKTYR